MYSDMETSVSSPETKKSRKLIQPLAFVRKMEQRGLRRSSTCNSVRLETRTSVHRGVIAQQTVRAFDANEIEVKFGAKVSGKKE